MALGNSLAKACNHSTMQPTTMVECINFFNAKQILKVRTEANFDPRRTIKRHLGALHYAL